jgi:hypothetical protein
MTPSQLKQFLTEYTEAVWNQDSVPAMDRFYPPAYAHHDVSRPDVRSLADYKAWAADLMQGLPDLHVAIDDLIVDEGARR